MMRTTRYRAIVAALTASLVLSSCSSDAGGSDPGDVIRGLDDDTSTVAGWPVAAPVEVDLRPRALRKAARTARRARSSCFAVFRDGQLAGEWNWGTGRLKPRQVFSVTKSVASALVGIAVKDGALELDDPVSRYVPAWRGTDSEDVTVRNLLSNDSGRFWSEQTDYVDMLAAANRTRFAIGLEQEHEPGEVWAYNNAAIQVLDAVLREATGQPVEEFAQERLFDPLDMRHSVMTTDESRSHGTQLFYGLQTTCLDLARFGRLYLDGGEVDGEQILPPDFVEESIGRSSTSLNAAYGFLWWLNRPGVLRGSTDELGPSGQPIARLRGQLAPGAPEDLYAALGLGGQVLMVDPGSDTIVVRLSKDLRTPDSYGFTDAAKVITDAVK